MKRFFTLLLCTLLTVCVFTGCADTPQQPVKPDESMLLDSNVITNYLCRSLGNKSQPETPEFNYLPFVFNCFYYKDQPDFCYYDETPVNPQTAMLTIDIAGSDRIIHQVFDDSWDITQNTDSFFVEVTDTSVLFPTEVGWGLMGYYAGDYIYSEFSDDNTQVVSHFELFGSDWDASDIAHKFYGNYKIIFDITTENEETFLRFNRFEKE